MDKIPIFIVTRDRVEVLKKCIESLKQLSTPYQVVIHDNRSTYIPLLEYLKAGEKSGELVVYRNERNELDDVKNTINDYFSKGCRAQYYVVTDPDIELLNVKSDMLEYYKFLLESNAKAVVVGPMLEINDIPDYYPLKQRAIEGHTRQFWGKTGRKVNYNDESLQVLDCLIDTTFGLYRREFKFVRHNSGIRTYAPYSARHLDWYIDPDNMTYDQKYYLQSSSDIGHWSSSFLKPLIK